MKSTPDNLACELATLYEERASIAEATLMAERLTDFVGLLLEIEGRDDGPVCRFVCD